MTTLPPLPPVPPEKVTRNAHGITVNAGQDEEALRAWAIAYAEAAVRPYIAALERIAAIENQDFGGDWDEIEQARQIAVKALENE